VTPDGSHLLVANQGTETHPGKRLSVIDTTTFRPIAQIPTGNGSHGVVVDPAGTRAYVTDVYGGDVAVVDLRTLRTVAHIQVGNEPNGISFSQFAPTIPRTPVLKLPLPAMPSMNMG